MSAKRNLLSYSRTSSQMKRWTYFLRFKDYSCVLQSLTRGTLVVADASSITSPQSGVNPTKDSLAIVAKKMAAISS
eukprot:IDg4344t1